MNQQTIISKTAEFVEAKFKGEGSGHDWWHMYRVWQLARTLADEEPTANKLVTELGALLHDIADWKFHDDDEAGPKAARQWLESIAVAEDIIAQVEYIVRYSSWKGGTNKHAMKTIEGKIVQDADRLDAIGAIGIARVFAFGGMHDRPLYDPANKIKTYKTVAEAKQGIKDGTSVNHFYEKLLLLKDGMHTDAAKKLAEHRHAVMEQYLEEFYAEWDGQR